MRAGGRAARRGRSWLLLAALAGAACAAPSARRAPAAEQVAAVPAACPAVPDVPELLARHARAYGSSEAVARALPRSFAGRVVTRSGPGAAALVLDREGRFAWSAMVGGLPSARGVDADGPWVLPEAGVLLRLREDEAVALALEAWLGRRAYLAVFDPGRDRAACAVGAAGPRLTVRYDPPALGTPELAFDLADAALLSVTHRDAGGDEVVLDLGPWSAADPAGVRWPAATRRRSRGGEAVVTWTRSAAGVECPGRPAEDCLAPPRPPVAFSWPARAPVRVPAAFFLDEVLVRAGVGDHAFWGLLDSGATVHVVDTGSPLASGFRPAAAQAPGARQEFTLGELPGPVALGDLTVRHFPAAAAPLPSFEEFGARRPELLVGYPLFLGTAVRIDYARQEVLISEDAGMLRSPGAVAVPLKILEQTVVAEGRIDGVAGWFVLDSGDTEALDLFQDWAEDHGFPGPRPTYRVRQRAEIGDGATEERRMRPATFELGPIHLAEPLAALDTVRSPSSRIAGQVGNGVLGRCAAVVFDVAHRTLWLEPPCDRALPEDLSGWTLARRDSPAYPERPWVVSSVVPGGAADLAGVRAGDRLLELGGRAAILERSTFEPVTRQATGAAVRVAVARGAAREEKVLLLVRLPLP